MAYQYITDRDSPNFTPSAKVKAKYGVPRTIDSITVHWWGDPANKPTFKGTVDYLCRAKGTSSAHEVIEAGRVACIVNHFDAAWHAGNSKGNATSIGLELNPRCSDEDYETAGERIADIWKAYGRKIPLVPHNSWKATQCPGNYVLSRLASIAEKYYATPTPTPTPAPGPKKKVDDMLLLRCNDGPKAGAVVLVIAGKVIPVLDVGNYAALQTAITPVGVTAAQYEAILGGLA